MGYNPVTPFRRTIDAAHLERLRGTDADLPTNGVNKWEALRELSAARAVYGLNDRDLTVLQALLSFHPHATLGNNGSGLVVHPSNLTICERLNGMPCSTMRRHLGNLVQRGILGRRDSPNGKRYSCRQNGEKEAFGLDLTPIVQRFREFCQAAEIIRAEADRHQRLRATISLMRRDLAGLATYGETVRPDISMWREHRDLAMRTAQLLRRKLGFEDLATLETALLAALNQARNALEVPEVEDLSIRDAQIEHHYQNSDKELHDLESGEEKHDQKHPTASSQKNRADDSDACPSLPLERKKLPKIPIGLVLSTCREISNYANGRIRHWHDLTGAAEVVRPMMGISPTVWQEAKHVLGPEDAAIVLTAMLERFSEIKSPGGYLRDLVTKAQNGTFSSGPMVMALVRRKAA